MNKELWAAYHDLTKLGKDSLVRLYAQSPVMQKLLSLLEQHPQSAMASHAVVEQLYGISLSDTDFPVHRNRFYKLRKKMLEDIREITQGQDTEAPELSPEEMEFYRARKLAARNDYANARQVLEKLLKRCERLCLYELLPGIVDELTVTAGVFNEHMESRWQWARKYEEMTLLLNDFHRMRSLNKFLALESQNRLAPEKADELLEQMRRIMVKHPDQPRFAKIYYFTASNIASVAFGKRLHAVRRLLNKLQELLEAYPDVPCVTAEPGHQIRTHFFRLQMEMIYHWQKKDYETAYQFLSEYWQGVTGSMARYNQLSDNAYRNKANLEIRTHRFKESEETIFSYIKFLKENGKQGQTSAAWSMLAYLYTRAYPQLKPDNPEYLLKRLDEYQELLYNGGHPQLRMENAAIRTDFLFIHGRFKEAWDSFVTEPSQEYFKLVSLPEAAIFYGLFKDPDSIERKEKMLSLLAHLKKRRKENAIDDVEDVLVWFIARLKEHIA